MGSVVHYVRCAIDYTSTKDDAVYLHDAVEVPIKTDAVRKELHDVLMCTYWKGETTDSPDDLPPL